MRRSLPADALTGLLSAGRGLDAREVATRRARFGDNDILGGAAQGWRELVRDTVKDPMLWFLVGTSVLFAVTGDYQEALVLLAALVPFVGMDAFLHRRTQASTEGLRGRLAHRVNVVRDGVECVLPATELVVGDLVVIGPDALFPADGLIIASDGLQVDESALTGEAYPVRKLAFAAAGDGAAVGAIDSAHWGWAGTRALTGTAQVRIAYTGSATLYGEIVQSARSGAHARTPLQQAIANLVAVLLGVALVLCLGLAVLRWYQGHGLVDALISAVTLAVAALPEEFPVVFTFFLGVGVYRLARRQALVRRAVVVENIGRVSTICSDKTGTLTEGRLTVAHVAAAAGLSDQDALHVAALASRGESGDPLDVAILAVWTAALPERIATFPFTEDRKRETSIVRAGSGVLLAATKGAPETILALCSLSAAERQQWLARVAEFAAGAHKVIACAMRQIDEVGWPGGEPDHGFTFTGLLACEDPVRDGVLHAITQCRNAGIRVIMVTGDHPMTARAIATEIGLGGGTPRVITADEAEQHFLRNGDFFRDVDVIARAVPAQKLSLVKTLQAANEVVAVTGDGVNDVPALQAADIGIAMGQRGTQSAREVAAIVLLDDNFRSIVRAIAEGRQLFENLKLSFAYLLVIHLPLVASAALIPLAGYPLLYLPIHIVWLELIIHPTALLVFQDQPTTQHLAPVQRNRQLRFFDVSDWLVITLTGTLITVLIIVAYVRSLGAGYDVEHARAMALVGLCVASAAVTAALTGLRTPVSRIVSGATVALPLLLVQTPALSSWLHVSPLHGDDWFVALGGGAIAALPLALRWLRRPPRTASTF